MKDITLNNCDDPPSPSSVDNAGGDGEEKINGGEEKTNGGEEEGVPGETSIDVTQTTNIRIPGEVSGEISIDTIKRFANAIWDSITCWKKSSEKRWEKWCEDNNKDINNLSEEDRARMEKECYKKEIEEKWNTVIYCTFIPVGAVLAWVANIEAKYFVGAGAFCMLMTFLTQQLIAFHAITGAIETIFTVGNYAINWTTGGGAIVKVIKVGNDLRVFVWEATKANFRKLKEAGESFTGGDILRNGFLFVTSPIWLPMGLFTMAISTPFHVLGVKGTPLDPNTQGHPDTNKKRLKLRKEYAELYNCKPDSDEVYWEKTKWIKEKIHEAKEKQNGLIVGHEAEIVLISGKWKGKWIPCTVTSKNENGTLYSVFVDPTAKKYNVINFRLRNIKLHHIRPQKIIKFQKKHNNEHHLE